jgi:glutamate carboxypeptidase
MTVTNHRLPAALELLQQLVDMESPSLDRTLVNRLARFVGDQFKALGAKVKYLPAGKFGDHLQIEFNHSSQSEPRLLILGHTDTVFPAGEGLRRPFSIENGRALGPGVFDMKAGIVLAWWALSDLASSGKAHRPVTLLFTSDEEVGSPSSRELIEKQAQQCCAVLVLEPSLPGGALKTARKGVGRFTVKAIGRAAHAGVDPENGINAIEEIAHQVIRLHQMTNAGRGTTVNVGAIQGGTRPNVVPAAAGVDVDVRISSLEEARRLTEEIRALTPKLSGARLEIHGGINRPPMERTTETERLFKLARAIAAELGVDLQEGSTGGASDGNFTAALGIPTLDGLGAVGDFPHGVTEYVEIESLPARAALLTGLIQRIQPPVDSIV